jgi:hypothetical protein
MFAAKMSRVREKIPIRVLRNRKTGLFTCLFPFKTRANVQETSELRKIPCFSAVFELKILANWWDLPPTVGQIFR